MEIGEDNTSGSKVLAALTSTTVRGIVDSVNLFGIKREDIVSILKEDGQFVLLYFKIKV